MTPEEMEAAKASFADYMFRLEGNLYGRRTAGSVVKDPCVFRCQKTLLTLVHHVDDVRCAGPASMLN